MDPVEAEHLRQALSSQRALIGQHEATLVKVQDSLQQLASSINCLNWVSRGCSLSPPCPSLGPFSFSRTIYPNAGPLFRRLRLFFSALLCLVSSCPLNPSDAAKIAFVASLLAGRTGPLPFFPQMMRYTLFLRPDSDFDF